MNINYAGNVLKSKVRAQLRKTGLVESITAVLDKHPELAELYGEAVGGGDLKDIEQRFKAIVKANPGMRTEIADKARKNVYDLPESVVKGALELMASSGALETDEQEMVDMLLGEYAETNDIAVLREGTMKLAELQISKL